MKTRRLQLLVVILLMLPLLCGGWLHIQRQQSALNRALMAALEHGDSDTALLLVKQGADPNTRLDPSSPPNLKLLLDQWLHHTPSPVNESPTAFMIACGLRWDLMDVLFFSRVDVKENLPLLQTMLDHDANVHARADVHTDNIHANVKPNRTALHEAVAADRWRTVQLLLEHGANVNAQDRWGLTPLLGAALNESTRTAQILLEHGAQVDARDADGDTPLMRVCAFKQLDQMAMVRLLLRSHADVNYVNLQQGSCALAFARHDKNTPLIDLLKQAGAKENLAGRVGGVRGKYVAPIATAFQEEE